MVFTSTRLYRRLRSSAVKEQAATFEERLRRRRRIARSKIWRREMSATVSNIVRPAVTKARRLFTQLLSASGDAIASYFIRRAAIAHPPRFRGPRTARHRPCAFRDRSRGPRPRHPSRPGEDLMMTSSVAGTDGRHDPGRLCRRVPDLLHEGRVRRRILHCRHSAVVDRDGPGTAGGLLAPLFVAMDLFALRYWKPSTWSKPDLVLLLPGLVIGIGLATCCSAFSTTAPSRSLWR